MRPITKLRTGSAASCRRARARPLCDKTVAVVRAPENVELTAEFTELDTLVSRRESAFASVVLVVFTGIVSGTEKEALRSVTWRRTTVQQVGAETGKGGGWGMRPRT